MRKLITEKETLMNKKSIKLSEEQRGTLEQLISVGHAPARKIMHAHILLKADSSDQGPNWPDEQIREAFGVSVATICRVRQRFLEHGLEDALTRRPQPQ